MKKNKTKKTPKQNRNKLKAGAQLMPPSPTGWCKDRYGMKNDRKEQKTEDGSLVEEQMEAEMILH